MMMLCVVSLLLALGMSSVESISSCPSQPSLKDLQRAKADIFTGFHSFAGVDPTKLRVVPHKGRYLQSLGGWAYATLYYSQCGAPEEAFVAYGTATDVCLSSEASNGQPTRSFIYSCTDNTWSLAMYNSPNCDDTDFISTNTFNVAAPGDCGVYPPTMSDDDIMSQYVARYYCESGPAVDLKADYVLNKYSDSATCSELGSFSGSKNHGCFPYHFDNQTFSVKTAYPAEKFYGNADCTGEVILSDSVAELQESCVAPPSDDGNDDVDSMNWTAYTSSITCTVPSTTSCSGSGQEESLSTGALIGIIVGAAVGSILFLAVIYMLYRSCGKKAQDSLPTTVNVPV